MTQRIIIIDVLKDGKACVYPTCNGAKRIFKKIANDNVAIEFYMKRI